MLVTVVSVLDVVCATTTAAASAVLALEIVNNFLINIKGKRKKEKNKQENQWVYSFT